ncbi:DUF6758 family protein [Marinitenerispora sediminis]|uniref:Phosphotransacetylase n=1 Tax=Marinitenerispora sediminis TaxID=1931232 RepID=A0A368SZV0_9ACTN|nr:DUF6758 family protein [Marinitenerispora sediminis]RCV50540.1 hypothetical protein DEF28_17895 [Marinitenerispora sediminis]RCV51747.1 hypothetical protein DEF24_22835 [Marinitenerispora sediminis]RCV59388.1 hypothetical protein DEF23_07460 [Marinitenerispora sediminis]
MKSDPSCPRCGRAVHPPSLWSSAWQCDAHGPVAPLQPLRDPNPATLDLLLATAEVPVWIPWPLPTGWVITGFAQAGDERSGGLAAAVALSGPAPLGGVGELVAVAEDPGIGLAARLAGLEGPDPGDGFDSGPPAGKIRHDGHEIALWSVPAGDDRAVYAGEAMASWVWLVFSPADAGVLICEIGGLRDLRDRNDGGAALEPPFGAPTPFLYDRLRPLD